MKYLISILGLIFINLFVNYKASAQYFYPPASLFNPTANIFRGGAKLDLKKWLEVHRASYFASLIAENNLESELNNKKKTITILAPTDEAFDKLSTENKAMLSDSGKLNKLIKYHLIPGIISEDNIKNQKITTLEGNSIKLSGTVKEDKSETIVFNNKSVVQKIEKVNDNLIVVLIDEVLIPSNQIQ